MSSSSNSAVKRQPGQPHQLPMASAIHGPHKAALKAGFGGSNSGAAPPPGSLAAAGATQMYVGGVGPKAKALTTSAEPGAAAGGIGRPTNVQRVVHVEWDPKTGTFKGLPSVWKSALPEGAWEWACRLRSSSVKRR